MAPSYEIAMCQQLFCRGSSIHGDTFDEPIAFRLEDIVEGPTVHVCMSGSMHATLRQVSRPDYDG